MLTFISEFFFGVFIGFVLGQLINGMTFNSQLRNMGILIKNMKSRKSSIMKPSANKPLWNDLKRLYDKRTELDPRFSFKKISFEIYKLLEEKAVAASTIQNFYFRRTTPRRKTIETIQR